MTSSSVLITVVSLAVAAAIALLTWSAFDIGTSSLARYRRLFTEKARFSMRELFLFVEPEKLFLLNLGLMLLAGALGWMATNSLVVACTALGLTAFLPRLVLRLLRRRRLERLEQQLPDTLLMLAGGMKAGVSLTQAIAQVVLESRPPSHRSSTSCFASSGSAWCLTRRSTT